MADVNIKYDEYAAFPTMLYKFKPKKRLLLHSEMATYIKVQKCNDNEIVQTEHDLYNLSTFRDLADVAKNVSAEILQKLGYKYDKLEMTGMWGNWLKAGQSL